MGGSNRIRAPWDRNPTLTNSQSMHRGTIERGDELHGVLRYEPACGPSHHPNPLRRRRPADNVLTNLASRRRCQVL